MGHTHSYKFGFKKKKSGKESQSLVSHPELGSDPPIGSDRESGSDTFLSQILFLILLAREEGNQTEKNNQKDRG